jgi:hypothetical protein
VSITLHIERLVLDAIDLPPAERALLGAIVETELARLLADRGPSRRLTAAAHVPRLDAPAIGIPQTPGGAALGVRVAAALAEGLGR